MYKKIFTLLFVFVTLQSCGIYKFTGASLDPNDKTFTVKYFENKAPLVNPSLSQKFTEELKDKLMTQTNLNLTPNDGDLTFEGEIINYETKPIAINQNEQADYNRLTITVRVKYTSINNPKFDFDEQISKYADYESWQILSDVEAELCDDIVNQLTDYIFDKAVVNW